MVELVKRFILYNFSKKKKGVNLGLAEKNLNPEVRPR